MRSTLNVERSGEPAVLHPTVPDQPWPGLASFTEDQAGLFHGRDAEIRDLARRTERNPLTVLFGQSGLGKSSLLQAGVFPRLRAAGYWPIYVRLDHSPGAPTPTEQVKALVAADTARAGTWTKPGSAKPGETLWEFFHHRDDRLIGFESSMGILPISEPLRRSHGQDARATSEPPASTGGKFAGRPIIPVLVFDQFEELFTLGAGTGGGPERARAVAFMSELAELVENRPSEQLVARLEESSAEMDAFDFSRTDYRVVISLREDFLPHLESLKTIMPALMENRMRLARMTGTQALEAVLKPGAGLVTEDVARTIVEFVAGARGGSAERLAELDVEPPLLSVICRELNERRRALGQAQITADLVSGNRREILTDFYERSVADLPAPMRAFVEDRLLTKSGFRDNLALETALEEPGVTRPLLDMLVARRLLRIEDRLGVQRVELTHDVLAEVIRASRDARQQRLALEEARGHEQRALAAATQRTRKLRWLVGSLAAVIVALCAAGAYGLQARRLAFQSASRTDATFASRLLAEGNTGEGLAYYVRAARKDPHNPAVAPRLLSALIMRSFLLPDGAPLGLPAATRTVDYSLDGRRIWALGDDNIMRVVDVRERRVIQEFRFEQPIRGVAFPSENDRVFVARFADNSLRMFDSATGKPLTAAAQTEGLVDPETRTTLAMAMRAEGSLAAGNILSADGRWLAVRGESKIFVWDVITGERRATLDCGNRVPSWVVFSPDGQRILMSAPGGFIRQWTTVDGRLVGEEMRIPTVLAGQTAHVAYSRDSRRFVVCALTAGSQLFDATTYEKIGPVMPQGLANRAFFSRDGQRLFTLGLDGENRGSIRTWHASTGAPLLPPWPVAASILQFALSRDGNLFFTVGRHGSAQVWDTRTGQPIAEPTPAFGKNPRVDLSPNGREFVVAVGAKLHFCQVSDGAARPLELRRSAPYMNAPFIAGSPARFLWFGREGAKVVDVSSGRESPGGFAYPRPFSGIPTAGSDVRPDAGAMVVATADSNHNLNADSHWEAWRLEPGKISAVTRLEAAPVGTPPGANGVLFSPAGDLVALGANTSAQTIRVWSLTSGKPITPPLTLDSRIIYSNSRPGSFSPDGTKFAAGGTNGVVRVWEMATSRALFDLGSGGRNIRFVAFSPDGTRIAVGAAGTLRLWDAQTGKPLSELLTFEGNMNYLDFFDDGRKLLMAESVEGARIYDGHTLEPFGETFSSSVRSLQLSPDGTRIATANNAAGARIWDATTLEPTTEPILVPGIRVVRADFSPDGRYLRTENANNTFHLWPAPPAAAKAPVPQWLLDLATICAGKRLTDEGKMENAADAVEGIDAVRRTLAALPDGAPYVEWGRWFLADHATRSIAPGFTITPVEAEKLAKEMAPAAPSP